MEDLLRDISSHGRVYVAKYYGMDPTKYEGAKELAEAIYQKIGPFHPVPARGDDEDE